MKSLAVILLLLLMPGASSAADDLQQLIQLVDYVGVDYREAVSQGEISNPAEYREMLDFTAAISRQIAQLPKSDKTTELTGLSSSLSRLINDRGDAAAVHSVSAQMRTLLISKFNIVVVPRNAPDLSRGRQLYMESCSSCHGGEGVGDGPMATGMEPMPTNFLDRDRYRQRTLYGLYNVISQGVVGTAMTSFHELGNQDRWNLAFYVGQLATTSEELALGQSRWNKEANGLHAFDLQTLTTRTPEEANAEFGNGGAALMAWLRANPELMYEQNGDPLSYSITTLAESLAAYKAGDAKQAYQLAIQSYLEGFELVESAIDTVDPKLRRTIEDNMTAYRNMVRKGRPVTVVEAQVNTINQLLAQAQSRLESTALSGKTAFLSAFIILLREGLEALLVIAALAAFLVKTSHRHGLPYLYGGTGVALLMGVLTWWLSNTLIDISGAQRELTEGIAAITAAVILFYVGFWMHSKTSAAQWKRFIEDSIKKALSSGTLWGLAGLAFIAVYREVFETVLFYQALWAQTDVDGQGMVISGFTVATVVLLATASLILRYSAKLPLRQFFNVSSIFMFLLAFIFTGKGISALQEAGKLPINPVSVPRIELLGIYPNLEVLCVQAALVVVAAILLFRQRSPVNVS